MTLEADLDPVEPALLRTLVENHRTFLDFLERRIGDRAGAEDILQDAFVKSMAKAGSLRDEESSVAWFYRVLRNATVDYYRRRAARDRSLEGLAREWAEGGDDDAELREAVCRCVGQLATTLKPAYAEALRRIDIDGQSVKDFAASAGMTAGNAAVRVFRARKALRERVEQACGTCAEHGCLNCSCRDPASDRRTLC